MANTFYAPRIKLNLLHEEVKADGTYPPVPFNRPPDITYCFRQEENTMSPRITFEIQYLGFGYPNFGFMNMSIYNADRNAIIGSLNLPKGDVTRIIGVELYAGYGDDTDLSLIFQGIATEVFDCYIQPNDELKFYCQFCPDSNTNSFSFDLNITLMEALNQVLMKFHSQGSCPIPSIVFDQFYPVTLAETTLEFSQIRTRMRGPRLKPLHAFGTLFDCIDSISKAWDVYIPLSATSIAVIDVADNQSQFIPSFVNPDAIVVNYQSGLVGSPTINLLSSQVNFTTILNPLWDFSRLFIMNDVGANLSGPNGSFLNIDNSRIKSFIGYPKKIIHKGDTRGRDWYTEITALTCNSFYDDPTIVDNIFDQAANRLPRFITCN